MRREARVILALGRRALSVQFRRAQLLMPTFVLPLMLLAVIASGTSAAQGLRDFPDIESYVAFVIPGTIVQGALLAGLTTGTALAGDIEFGFFDRLLAAPVRRASLVLGRLCGTLGLGLLQAAFFLLVAMPFGASYPGGVSAVVLSVLLAAVTAVGIGAIAFIIAALVYVLRIPAHVAIGSSLAIGFFAALAGFIGKAATAQVDPLLGLIVFASALVASPVGAAVSQRSRPRVLMLLLAALVGATALRMLWQALTGV